MQISKVAVVGLGTMGAGIAEVLARNGYDVVGIDAATESVAAGQARVEGSTARAVTRGKLTEAERSSILGRMRTTTDMTAVSDRDLVIEAVPERLELKQALLGEIDGLVGPNTILATNTSSLSVTDIAVSTSRPAKVVGLHFFNPAPVQRFIEIVRTVVTDDETLESMSTLADGLDKVAVVVGDKAGFIANALLFGYLNHAAGMYESKYASREDIDAAMRLGCGLPMGPLALLDLIGLDTAYEILETMYRQGRDRLHAPAPILKQLVTAGMKGRKTGRGFYEYVEPNSSAVVAADLPTPAEATAHGISRVAVVGSGTMAAGIAEVVARAGIEVVVVTRGAEQSARVINAIEKSLGKHVERGRLSAEERDTTLARGIVTTSLDELADVDLVIEAITEDSAIKTALFTTLDEVCKPETLLASTTSSLPVIELAAATNRAGAVLGLHFFNPAPAMALVEVVRTVSTEPAVVDRAASFVRAIGKHPVVCADRAGFIVNGLLFPYLNDAVRMLEARYASEDDIDSAMKLGCGYPMGPFELLDVIGLDVSLAIQRTLFAEYREPGFAPAPLLEQLVTAGFVGRKAGRGFRQH